MIKRVVTKIIMTPEEIKEERKILGMNQSEYASFIGVSFHTLQSYELGRRERIVSVDVYESDMNCDG